MTRLVRGLVASTLALAPVTAFAQGNPQAPSDTTTAPPAGMHQGSQRAPRLGVALIQLTPELRTYFAVPNDRGAIVAKVVPGSPAAAAGVKVGDVVVTVGSEPITDARDVQTAIGAAKPNAPVTIEVIRDKKPMQLSAKLGAARLKQDTMKQDTMNQDTMKQDTMAPDTTAPDTTTPDTTTPDTTGQQPQQTEPPRY